MPTLNWIGKDKVVTHHNDVPYRVLDRKYTFGDAPDSGNKIIHGDNLEALKALLPEYEGKIKCIYIDPPYNTGNEGWVYNDNVNDPHIRKWLGQVVGSEVDDLTRHDKWLCMMYPRLVLLQKLLSEDGAIFISIDDNELYSLKWVCNEIFGASCFCANISWQRTYSTRNDSKEIVSEVEHILVYSKSPQWSPKKLPRTAAMNSKYKNPDGDYAPWRSDNACAPGAATHQGMVYAIQHPFTGEYLYPYNGACWRYQQAQMLEYMSGWCEYELRDLGDDIKRAEICGVPANEVRSGVCAIVLKNSLEDSRTAAEVVLKRGPWPRFFFSKNGLGGIARKTYLDSVEGVPPTNLFKFDDCGHTDEAKKELLAIFKGKAAFDTPKPTRLISRILQIAADKDSIVLDTFAGSGTTAHAILNLNKQDGGNRKFILCEMCDYAESITAERVRRVMSGYGEGKNAVEGTGGSFDFYELGETIFDPVSGNLNDNADTEQIRRYVWFSETNSAYVAPSEDAHPFLLGSYQHNNYYFFYIKGEETCLDWDFLSTFTERDRAEMYIIYADRCVLTPEEMIKHNIVFKKIPRDIRRV